MAEAVGWVRSFGHHAGFGVALALFVLVLVGQGRQEDFVLHRFEHADDFVKPALGFSDQIDKCFVKLVNHGSPCGYGLAFLLTMAGIKKPRLSGGQCRIGDYFLTGVGVTGAGGVVVTVVVVTVVVTVDPVLKPSTTILFPCLGAAKPGPEKPVTKTADSSNLAKTAE